MMGLHWTERALSDLTAIGDYIAHDNPAAARAWVDQLRAVAALAATSPGLGRVVPECGRADLRETFLKDYRVVYQVVPDGIVVLTVFEGRRRMRDIGLVAEVAPPPPPTLVTLEACDIYRDGGSYQCRVRDAQRRFTLWLQVGPGDGPSDRTYQGLSVAVDSSKPRAGSSVEPGSPEELAWIRCLVTADLSCASPYSAEHFARLLDVLRARHRPPS